VSLQIYNTLTGRKEELAPRTPGKLGIYVCGPTVYDFSHVGHARVYVAFDTIIRFLRRRYAVTFVRNFTDVDDKIIKRAAELGTPSLEVSERFIREYHTDMASLGVARADVEPKVTEHIPDIVALIEKLIAGEFAYAVGGDVYYAVTRFETYGRLGRRSLDDMEAGARVEVDERKRHPMDFALWKSAKPGEPSWPSPWGNGRPGWHIECSAMSARYLGASFDLHGGGKDLIFPHHENEIAQSEAVSRQPLASIWMHNGFVNIDNEKMSKSLGNFFTIRQVLDKFDAQTLRYYLLTTHYRSPINFSDASLRDTETRVKYVYETMQRLAAVPAGAETGPWRDPSIGEIRARFDAAMEDDFNTAKALGDLSEVWKLANDVLANPRDAEMDARTLRAIRTALFDVGGVLGLFTEEPSEVLGRMEIRRQNAAGVDPAAIEKLIEARNAARRGKDFKLADQIRDQLKQMGVVIKDSPSGTTWEMGS
jgi:cysteinyl-tRNA synthetase